MKKQFLSGVILAVSILVFSSTAFATTPSASIWFNETYLAGEGVWQYDYTFRNLSTNGEYLYSVWLDFAQIATETGVALPSGWDGSVWMGTNTTNYLDTYSTGIGNDIAPSSGPTGVLSGFSFKVNYQAGSIPYTAYFDNHAEGFSSTSGLTVPEPISSMLFLTGGVALAVSRYLKRRKISS